MIPGVANQLRSLVVVALVTLSTSVSFAAEPMAPAKLDDSVDRALVYLARQQRGDGTWDHQQKPSGQDADASSNRRAITGLVTLAFLSAGHAPESPDRTPDAGKHGRTVRKAVDALTDAVPDDGYVGGKDEKPMYSQAIVTLALAQATGVEPSAERRAKQHAVLRRLVKVILAAQAVKKDSRFTGGWRNTRDAADSDLSLSGWNALTLRAADAVGVPVPPEALRTAADFIARCHVPDKAGFSHQPGGPVLTGTTATGVLCLHLLERDTRPEARTAAAELAKKPADGKSAFDTSPYYGMFQLTQAASHADGGVWRAVGRPTLDRLIKAQESDGGWPKNWPADCAEPGRVYRTAMATLTLTVTYRLLPAYQR